MVVRGMAEGDAEALHAIHGACLTRSLLGHGYTHRQVEAWMAGRTPGGYVEAARNGERFLVAESGGAVVGFASWRDAELLSLFVHPEHQKQGIGSALATACLTQAARSGGPIGLVSARLRMAAGRSILKRALRAAIGAEPFYRRYSFEAVGPGAMSKRDVEIPHTRMERAA